MPTGSSISVPAPVTTAAGSSSRAPPPTSSPPAPPSPASISRPTSAPDRRPSREHLGPGQLPLDEGSEGGQRQGPLRQDRVVEPPDVEGGAEARGRLVVESLDLELTELVGEGLPGPGDVAVDLVDDVVGGEGGVLEHDPDRFAARPAEGVHPGVDAQPARAPAVERRDPDPVEIARI